MTPALLRKIERWNYILSAILIAFGAFNLTWEQFLGLMIGALIASVNFSLIRRLVDRWSAAAADQRAATAFMFVPKMAGLIAVVFLAIRFVPMSPVAFAAGFSVFLVSIAIELLRFRGGSPEPNGHGSAS